MARASRFISMSIKKHNKVFASLTFKESRVGEGGGGTDRQDKTRQDKTRRTSRDESRQGKQAKKSEDETLRQPSLIFGERLPAFWHQQTILKRLREGRGSRTEKTRQNKIRQGTTWQVWQTRHDKTKLDKTRQRHNKARHEITRTQTTTRQSKTGHDKTRHTCLFTRDDRVDKRRQDKSTQDKTRHDKTKQEKTKTRQDKTRKKDKDTFLIQRHSYWFYWIIIPTHRLPSNTIVFGILFNLHGLVEYCSIVNRKLCLTGNSISPDITPLPCLN